MIPVSALTGAGYRESADRASGSRAGSAAAAGYPRLAVDRAFTLSGAGLVVTGTLMAGRIAVEDRLVLSPAGLEVRVRGLHAQNRPAVEALAGQRVALNITGPRLSKDGIARGDWVLHPSCTRRPPRLDAHLTLLPDAPPLRPDTEVHLHLGAAHVMARLSLLDRDRLTPGEAAMVRLTLVRRSAPWHAIGLSSAIPAPPEPSAAASCWTRRRRGAGGGRRRGSRSCSRCWRPARPRPSAACSRCSHTGPTVPPSSVPATSRQRIRPCWSRPFPPARQAGCCWHQTRSTAFGTPCLARLAAHHHTAPELPGLQAERLRLSLTERVPPVGFAGILQALVQAKLIAQDGPWLRLPQHTVTLSAQDQRIWQAARPMLEAERFRPPRMRDIAATLRTPEPVVRTT